ncbi:L-threonylcarbamoyladenylate synthase [Arenibacter sp. GZD96]|uniref:L-threonylcarbamoyladenylate synthase n=1 Tax=Aurantibrevibacter litoralis TaxID=3106030 RepID=UPI002AFF0A94|nr:L-threonylcarbamoyladenylate synthase [Arenibacter sp. GZD-96]MEA1787122.1 L-threonylcarbamoyladenylate synthase [Arenibacter sp. GZD-96]
MDTKLVEEANQCYTILQQGGIILYPTDTVWGIGCDATNEEAVKKIYALKKRDEAKAMICLVANEPMLGKYVKEVPQMAYTLIELSEKPITIIYDNPIGVAQNLIAEDQTLALRVAQHAFCQYLIKKLRKPLVSTSANVSGSPSPSNFKEISSAILKGVDYVVNLERDTAKSKPSSIIKLGTDGTVKVIRE